MEKRDVRERAFKAYFRTHGRSADQPANYSDVTDWQGKDFVVLRNVHGVLAVYRVRPSGALKRLLRWPQAFEAY